MPSPGPRFLIPAHVLALTHVQTNTYHKKPQSLKPCGKISISYDAKNIIDTTFLFYYLYISICILLPLYYHLYIQEYMSMHQHLILSCILHSKLLNIPVFRNSLNLGSKFPEFLIKVLIASLDVLDVLNS